MEEPKDVPYLFDYYNVNTGQVEGVICDIPVWMADYIDSMKNQLVEARKNYELITSVKNNQN